MMLQEAEHVFKPSVELAFTPLPAVPYEPGDGAAYAHAPTTAYGATVVDLPEDAAAGDVLTYSWTGGDPWVDSPSVALQVHDGEDWRPATAGPRPIDEKGYRISLTLDVEPAWAKTSAKERTFTWSAELRTAVRAPAPAQALKGQYRLVVNGIAGLGGGELVTYSLSSQPVTIP